MNFTRLNDDACTYKTNLKSSVGPGNYMISTPTVECDACFTFDPNHIAKGKGVSVCTNQSLIDVDSELMGITRKASNCPTDKYLPSAKPFCQTQPLADCRAMPKEDTRQSNPPCTLRSTGWNRWEWLCQNPQEKALIPFDYNINYRLVVKDNHRPCLPTPISPVPALPELNHDDTMYDGLRTFTTCMQPSQEIPGVNWRKACEYEMYMK